MSDIKWLKEWASKANHARHCMYVPGMDTCTCGLTEARERLGRVKEELRTTKHTLQLYCDACDDLRQRVEELELFKQQVEGFLKHQGAFIRFALWQATHPLPDKPPSDEGSE